jgi:DDE superfamily endonuclease.
MSQTWGLPGDIEGCEMRDRDGAPHILGQSSRVKRVGNNRSLVYLMVWTNCTWGDRLPLLVIGHKQTPHPLRTLNLTAIISEWLLSFYVHICDRWVLLLLDDNPAHQAIVDSTPLPANIHVRFLPQHAGGINPPLKMGITQHLKGIYLQTISLVSSGTVSSRPKPHPNNESALHAWLNYPDLAMGRSKRNNLQGVSTKHSHRNTMPYAYVAQNIRNSWALQKWSNTTRAVNQQPPSSNS